MPSRATEFRLSAWLAWRGLRAARGETVLRLAVALVAVVVALIGCTLYPTATARSERTAATILPVASRAEQSHGTLVVQTSDYFNGDSIAVVSVARVGDPTDVGHQIPDTGELVVSPEMASLLTASPQLRNRYPGAVIGTVPDAELLGPRALKVWRAVEPGALPADAGWLAAPGSGRGGADIAGSIPSEITLGLPMFVIGFLTPLAMLMVLVGTLGAARREQRLASMRLVGITDRQAKLAAALESGWLAAISVVVGFVVFHVVARAMAANLPVSGGIWPTDLRLSPITVGVVLGAFPVLCVAANWLGLRSLSTSPLGVERRSHIKRPTPWRLVPLVLGTAVLLLSLSGVVTSPWWKGHLIFLAALLMTLGLAGSLGLIVTVLARRAAQRSSSLPGLLAARRVEAAPSQSTRVALGLSVLVAMSGPLLLYFPLLADVAVRDLQAVEAQVGTDTFVARQVAATRPGDDAVRRAAWTSLDETTGVRRSLGLREVRLAAGTIDGDGPNVAVVDCAQLAAFTEIPEKACRSGLTVSKTDLSGSFFAYDERVTDEGLIGRVAVGSPLWLDLTPTPSRELKTYLDGFSLNATAVVSRDLFANVPVDRFSGLLLASSTSPGRHEDVRTAMGLITDGEVLSVHEQYLSASRTTREFRMVAMIAALLVVLIGGLATVITAYEQIRSSTAERRLLSISGADPSLFRRAIWTQTMAPSVLAVVPAVAVSLGLSLAFVEQVGDRVSVPVGGVLWTALLALATSAAATYLLTRLVGAENTTTTGE